MFQINENLIHKIQEIIQDELQRTEVPGFALGIVQNNDLIYSFTHNYANYETKEPITEDSAFMIGSITKLFTCIAIMQQYELGKFQLDDDVNRFLPKGKIITKKGWPNVTIKQLMTHTSGIGELRRAKDLFHNGFLHGFRLISYDDEPIPPLKEFHDLDVFPVSPAGQKWAYSNIAISILGYLVELFSGENFRDYVIHHILDPLEMFHSDMIRSERIKPTEVVGYKMKKGQFIRSRRWNNIIMGSGAMISTINDMKNFAIMLINRGLYKNHQILKPETFNLIWTPQYWAHPSFKEHTAIGLIYWLFQVNGTKILEHTGSVAGFTATFDCIPDEKLAFFTMCNRHQGLLGRITQRIKNRLIKLFTLLEEGSLLDSLNYKMDYINKITGYYGAYPGWLTSTRLYAEGGCEFKIYYKNKTLYMRSIFGINKIPKILIPTENPLIYYYKQKDAAGDVFYNTFVAFKQNQSSKIIECAHHFDRWMKKPLWKTFRLKLSLLIMIPALIIAVSVMIN